MDLAISAGAWGLAVIIVALLEAVKKTGKLPGNYVPVVSVVGGGVLGLVYGAFTDLTLVSGLVSGVTVGVVSCGLYDVVLRKLMVMVGLKK